MDIDFEKFIRNFRLFYRKVCKGHSNERKNQEEFKRVLEEELRKKKENRMGRNHSLRTTANQLTIREKKNEKTVKSEGEERKPGPDELYSSEEFSIVLVYGFLYTLVATKDWDAFQAIDAKIALYLEQNSQLDRVMLRKVKFEWGRISQLVKSKSKVHFKKMFSNSFDSLPLDVIYLVYKHISNGSSTKKVDTKLLTQISKIICCRIGYYEAEGSTVKLSSTVGSSPQQINIGYLHLQKLYVLNEKLPHRKEDDSHKENLLQILHQSAQNLLSQYSKNTAQFSKYIEANKSGQKTSVKLLRKASSKNMMI